jgi:hypothetical protein
MPLRGSLRTMAVEDLLDWLDRRLMRGAMDIECDSKVRTFLFDGGYLVGASSNQPGEHLGQLLLRSRTLDQETLGRAVKTQVTSGAPLSRVLHTMGAVDEQRLRNLLEEQAREGLLDTWTWHDGTFVFDETRGVEPELAISVRLRACLVLGRQRAHRWHQIRQRMPTNQIALAVGDRARISAAEDSEDDLEANLELVNSLESGLPIDDIVAFWHGRSFSVLDRLAKLLERGALVVNQPAGGPTASGLTPARDREDPPYDKGAFTVADLEQTARRAAAAGDSSGALEVARKALAMEPENPAAKRLFSELERAVFAELSRDLLTSFRVPRLLVDRAELDALNLSETERYLAGRIDGRWDLLSLMRVSPLPEAEALITFKRLADRGIISL